MSWQPPRRPFRAEEWIREVPFNPNDDHAQAAQLIIEKMAEARVEADDPRERSLDLDAGVLVVLLRAARHAHRMALSDFKRRNDPDWKVPRALPRGRRLYDYGEDAGAGLDDEQYGDWRRVKGKWQWVDLGTGWAGWWKLNWGRPRSNPGCFRGTRIAKAPLVEIYHLCNEWWRLTTGTPFHPNFDGIEPGPDEENLPTMNPAGRLFLLIAQDSDRRYSSDLCAKVHGVTYRKLDRHTIP